MLACYDQKGHAAFKARSRKPHARPLRACAAMESTVLKLRRDHPAWGALKLARRLSELGHKSVPSAATIMAILYRHGLIAPAASLAARH